MPIKSEKQEEILEALQGLPEPRIEEVLDFVEYLKIKEGSRGSGIDEASLRLQQRSLAKIWDSAEEDLYEL